MDITKMKAVVTTEYGDTDVLLLKEVEKPVPAAGEVLIRINCISCIVRRCASSRG